MTAMVTKGGEYWEAGPEQIIEWQRLYPNVDVYQELNAMSAWLDANVERRKTLRGMKRFCNGWLNRAQERGGSPQVQARKADLEARGVKSTRDMTMEDMMSRDWA